MLDKQGAKKPGPRRGGMEESNSKFSLLEEKVKEGSNYEKSSTTKRENDLRMQRDLKESVVTQASTLMTSPFCPLIQYLQFLGSVFQCEWRETIGIVCLNCCEEESRKGHLSISMLPLSSSTVQ